MRRPGYHLTCRRSGTTWREEPGAEKLSANTSHLGQQQSSGSSSSTHFTRIQCRVPRGAVRKLLTRSQQELTQKYMEEYTGTENDTVEGIFALIHM
jgi:hypothetical protein